MYIYVHIYICVQSRSWPAWFKAKAISRLTSAKDEGATVEAAGINCGRARHNDRFANQA